MMNIPGIKPLQGITVLDVSQAAAGPICGSFLAAFGANVIKIEKPDGGDMARRTPPYVGVSGVTATRTGEGDISSTILKRNRGKHSLALDLQQPEGLRIFYDLARNADVVLENFRPGVTTKLKIDYERIKAINEDIIYCSITGFGMSGPYKNWAAFDTIIQGMAGVMAGTGFPDGPPTKTGLLVGDTFAPLFALSSIFAALRVRDQQGTGQFIEVSMFDCLLSLVWDEPIEFFTDNGINPRSGNRLLRMAPWNAYQAQDGYVIICAGQQAHWIKICSLMSRPDLLSDDRFATMENRLKNVEALDSEVECWTLGLSKNQIVDQCQAVGVPCGPVTELAELSSDPQVKHRQLLKTLVHPSHGEVPGAYVADFPVRFSSIDTSYSGPAPALGEHTREILVENLGKTASEMRDLIDAGTIKTAG